MQYKLKFKNEDFLVTEVPLMPPMFSKSASEYTYVWVRKSGLTTFEAIERIRDFFKLEFNDLASQGLKDEDAITEQLISIHKILNSKNILEFNLKNSHEKLFVEIKHIAGYGNEPLKERSLHGNTFRIVLRNLNSKTAAGLVNFLHDNKYQSFINYYDNQRFGMPGWPYNTHKIGEAIVKGDWRRAYSHAKKTKNFNVSKRIVLKHKDFFKSINSKQVSFLVSAYNSFLWNRATSELVKKSGNGAIYNFKNLGKLHLPQASSQNLPAALQIEGFSFLHEEFSSKQTLMSRNLVVTTAVFINGLADDEHHPKRKKVVLSFFLPSGSYATMFVRQIFLKFKNNAQKR